MKKITLLLAVAILLGCSQSKTNDEIKYYDVERTTDVSQPLFLINDGNNNQLAKIEFKAGQDLWEISRGNDFWYGEMKNDKRKFYDKNGTIYAEIKFSDDGFKLRNPEGKLIWKVKISDNKIKISDNEEMNNAYEIKKKSDYFANLHQQEQPLGSIELSPQGNPAVIQSEAKTFFFTGPDSSPGAAILLIDQIQPVHQFMILSQLIKLD